MNTVRWREVERLYHAALAQGPSDRTAFLTSACAGDVALQREVESLLAQVGSAEGLLETPALAVAAQMVSDVGASGLTGRTIGVYQLQSLLGAGGMGEVFRARDTKLGRDVAIKILPRRFTSDPDRLARFEREARVLASLNHPNIATIHGLEESGDLHALILELVEGETLDQWLKARARGLPIIEALGIARQLADALDAAHEKGIIHRDLKPANIMITPTGVVKVLDFGLAKLQPNDRAALDITHLPTTADGTNAGVVLGTAAYMSPEQALGNPVDKRTDIWAFGCVLYEMLAGRLPFAGAETTSLLSAILHDEPPALRTIRHDLPPDVGRIVERALQKNPAARYASAADMRRDLAACEASLSPSTDIRVLVRKLARPRVGVPVFLVLALLVAVAGWTWQRAANRRWALDQAVPEIARLAEKEDFSSAFHLLRQADRYIPGHPRLIQLRAEVAREATIETIPPDAEIYIKPYSEIGAPWELLGRSPLTAVLIPRSHLRWRVTKPGFAPLEVAPAQPSQLQVQPVQFRFTLVASDQVQPGMLLVSGGTFALPLTGLDQIERVSLNEFLIDKHEVTNQQFKRFVDARGYEKREYWRHPFVRAGRRLSFEDAIGQFRDSTGQPGPLTWELGTFPVGQGDFPVAGVSWYEAAAYAEFEGKSLPTIFHWAWAAGIPLTSWILPLSNFGSAGPTPGGEHAGLSPSGAYDMAGNVKEWTWNEAGTNTHRRYILGGAFNEPVYMFNDPDAQDAFDRRPAYGFRCVKYLGSAIESRLTDPIEQPHRDYNKEKPVSDDVFRIYRHFYSYDKTDLKARVEFTDTTPEHWQRLTVTYQAAYGDERMTAFLFLPKKGSPPYQIVVFYPGSSALRQRSSEPLQMPYVDFIIRSGRAVLYPVYKSTYERGDGLTSDRPNTTSGYRDHVIQWFKDYSRSVDYLETRSDIDMSRLAYHGFSWGGVMGAIIPAVDPRPKVAVLVVGGLFQQPTLPEVEQVNFAPRVTIPVLMLNGRYDFVFPEEASQKPLFRLLGTADKDKKHIRFDTGHAVPRNELIKETLDWLDRYLGRVTF